MDKIIINTHNAPLPIGPYSQAVKAGPMLFVSGQIALDPTTGGLIMDNIQRETEQVMKNLGAILQQAEMDFNNIVKTTIFLSEMAFFPQVNEVYSTYFSATYPARETVAVKGLPRNVNVEISVIAM